MDLADLDPKDYERQADVDACLQRCGATMDQVRRWRREGLLPDVVQRQTPYHGSEVLYPKDTCAQIAATRRLFKQRNRVDAVGFELWWEGYPVDEKYWRPALIKSAQLGDIAIAKVRTAASNIDDSDVELSLQEKIARLPPRDKILSRIVGRLSEQALAALFGVIFTVIDGGFQNFADTGHLEKPDGDEAIVLKAVDFDGVESHAVLGHSVTLRASLQSVLNELTKLLSNSTLSEVAKYDAMLIEGARDDLRNAFRIVRALKGSTSWIYGPKAFGVRFATRIAEKRLPLLTNQMVLLLALLRSAQFPILPSDKIAEMAGAAETMLEQSDKAKRLAKKGGGFADLFSGKMLRRAFRDEVTLKSHSRQVESRRDDESA